MIVIGAGGFAIELLEILTSSKYGFTSKNLFFFDNICEKSNIKLFNEFQILKSMDEVSKKFNSISPDYCIGIGNPLIREKLNKEFETTGGKLHSVISENAQIGSFGTTIKDGCSILSKSYISNNVSIGKGCLIYGSVYHDTEIGDYTEISPGVNITGNCKIGSYTTIGTGATIIPHITIGDNVVIGAGSVITKKVPDNSKIVGVPGRII